MNTINIVAACAQSIRNRGHRRQRYTYRDGEGMKTCPDCKQSLPAEAFVPNPRGRDGLQTYCRACGAARSRAWQAANREAIKERKHAYYEKNKTELLAQQRSYYKANKTRILEAQRKPPEVNRAHVKAWAAKNPDKRKAKIRRQTARLSDGYVRQRLTYGTELRAADIPQPLVEFKRAHLLILRELEKGKL